MLLDKCIINIDSATEHDMMESNQTGLVHDNRFNWYKAKSKLHVLAQYVCFFFKRLYGHIRVDIFKCRSKEM